MGNSGLVNKKDLEKYLRISARDLKRLIDSKRIVPSIVLSRKTMYFDLKSVCEALGLEYVS